MQKEHHSSDFFLLAANAAAGDGRRSHANQRYDGRGRSVAKEVSRGGGGFLVSSTSMVFQTCL